MFLSHSDLFALGLFMVMIGAYMWIFAKLCIDVDRYRKDKKDDDFQPQQQQQKIHNELDWEIV